MTRNSPYSGGRMPLVVSGVGLVAYSLSRMFGLVSGTVTAFEIALLVLLGCIMASSAIMVFANYRFNKLSKNEQVRRLIGSYLSVSFRPKEDLEQLWSGPVEDLPAGAGGFIGVDQLLGQLERSPIYDVHVDDRALLHTFPAATVTAFVYRSRSPGPLRIVIFGNEAQAPTPTAIVPEAKQASAAPADDRRAKPLPDWAVA
jgi:hypothetical protein